jgi:lysylphosphatidylglycerol synthetase-like protein (DUF2156 family)
VRAYLRFLEREQLKPVWACLDQDTEQFLADELGWSALIAVAEERINPSEVEPGNDKNVRRKIHRAERDGVTVHEVEDWTGQDELKARIEQRCKDWADHRQGTQIHLTGVRPFDDIVHRRYFYATDKDGQICALVVLAQLATKHGFQIKWALEFPDAPLGAIEYMIAHVIRKMGDAGVKNATFGAGATPQMTRVDNIGGFRVRTLEKAYNGISHTFNLGNKGDFRSKFGSQQEPVRAVHLFLSGSCAHAFPSYTSATRRDSSASRACRPSWRCSRWTSETPLQGQLPETALGPRLRICRFNIMYHY